MAYADFSGRGTDPIYGPAVLAIAESCNAGDLLTSDGYKAVNTTGKRAAYAALEDRRYDSSLTTNSVNVARGVVTKKQPTFGTGGTQTRGDHGGTVADILYLSATAGGTTVTQPTAVCPQIVGYVVEQDTVFLAPDGDIQGYSQVITGDINDIDEKCHIDGHLIEGGNLALVTNKMLVTAASGNTTFAGTNAVAGAATLTGLLTCNGDVTCGAKSGLAFVTTKISTGNVTDTSTYAVGQWDFASTAALTLKTFTPAAGELFVIYDKLGGANHISSGVANLSTANGVKATSTASGSLLFGIGVSATGVALIHNTGWTLS